MKINLNKIVVASVTISTAVVTVLGNIKKIVPSRRKKDTEEE